MKKIIGVVLSLCTSIAFGATTVPVQLLNPTGSTAGQAIISTGVSSAPAWGGIGVNGIAAIAANTVLGNATASSASPTAITVTGCNGAAQALQWTNGSGFGCNSNIATSGANSNITGLGGLTTPVALPGVTNGSNAAAGQVGEYVANTTSGVSLTSPNPANATSVSLTAGDWDVSGVVQYSPAGGTTVNTVHAGISTVSATSPGLGADTFLITTFVTGNAGVIASPSVRISIASTTTVYLVAAAVFSGGTATCNGFIRARRVR